VGELITDGADVDEQDKDGWFALMVAAIHGHTTVVEALVQAGARIDLQDKGGGTPLMAAAFYDRTAIAEALVKAGAQLDLQNTDGMTALMAAVQKGRAANVKLLVEAGAQINLQNDDGWSALMLAASISPDVGDGHAALGETLVKAGALLDLHIVNSKMTALMRRGSTCRTRMGYSPKFTPPSTATPRSCS
jgi:ankyrin repeat protein